MSEPLEELRAQRALIKQHLDWLDAQIRQAEGSGGQQSPAAEQPTAVKSVDAPTATAADAPTATTVGTSTAPAATNASIFDIDENHSASSASDLKKAQIGCVLFFAVGTLLFLFLLFGLPYLMD